MAFKRNIAGVAAAATLVTSEAIAGSLGPERVVDALRGQMAQHYDFVVTLQSNTQRDQVLLKGAITAQNIVELPILNGFAATLSVEEAFRLADIEGIEWVWYLHPDEAQLTRNVVQNLTHALDQGALIANMSLGPPSGLYRKELDFDTPVARTTRHFARQGRLAVAAIGNTGGTAPGFVNPWSTPPWVLSVGAWDHRSGTVWEHSSTGDPQVPYTWPDVIAPGVNVIGPMTSAREKTPQERSFDEGNIRFRKSVPKEAWDKYTMQSGSSMAAAQVSNAAGQVAFFLTAMIKEGDPNEGDRLFSISVGPERITAHDNSIPRLTGRATSTAEGGMEYTYWMDQPWKMIKQILVDTALPVADAAPWEVGAGLVDPDYIRAEFGKYGISKSQLMAAKVIE
ncbi:MAG: S8 family serine peptidase [Sulfitobacter sp.]